MNITFEREHRNENEAAAAETLEKLVNAQHGVDDCRRLIDVVRIILEQAGVPAVCGAGGSHIWIHLEDLHDEDWGKSIENRWAIIRDN